MIKDFNPFLIINLDFGQMFNITKVWVESRQILFLTKFVLNLKRNSFFGTKQLILKGIFLKIFVCFEYNYETIHPQSKKKLKKNIFNKRFSIKMYLRTVSQCAPTTMILSSCVPQCFPGYIPMILPPGGTFPSLQNFINSCCDYKEGLIFKRIITW